MIPKYRISTYPAYPEGSGRYYASFARLHPHTYGAHTAHGKRTVMKAGTPFELGVFPSRKEALAAAREAVAARVAIMTTR